MVCGLTTTSRNIGYILVGEIDMKLTVKSKMVTFGSLNVGDRFFTRYKSIECIKTEVSQGKHGHVNAVDLSCEKGDLLSFADDTNVCAERPMVVPLGNIERGCLFKYVGHVYLKTSDDSAHKLKTGSLMQCGAGVMVEPVDEVIVC